MATMPPKEEGGVVRTTGFDKASGTVVATFRNDVPLKAHPMYAVAKGGDVEAAIKLVNDLVPEADIDRAVKQYGSDVVYLPVQAEERTGRNAIPVAVAARFADATGADIDPFIVQSNRAHHTGAKAMERVLTRSNFSGPVISGKKYVLVDDVSTMGSTLADLASYVREGCGEVVGNVLLVDATREGKIHPDRKTVNELEARHGDQIQALFGIAPKALTASEAGYLIGFRTTDELRNRVAAARQEREARLSSKGLPRV